jgi:hypothetical protein
MGTVLQNLEALWQEIEKDATALEGDVVGALRAAWYALKYNDVAAAMAAFATLVQDAKNDLVALEADANAAIPADVQAFLNNGQTLNAVVPVPILGNVVVIAWRGESVADLINAIAAGTTQL